MNEQYDQLKALASKCTFCGSCHAVCPVFDKIGTETACSRGRLFQTRFLSEEKIKANEHLAKTINRCTLCQACASKCPAGIKTTDVFMRLRKAIYEEIPMPLVKRLAFTGMTYRNIFDTCLSYGGGFQKLLFKSNPNGPGRIARFPIPAAGLNLRRVIPQLASKTLSRLVPEISKPTGASKARVLFFPGCMLNYVYPAAGKALIDVLVKNGVTVYTPRKLSCCGTPPITSGDFATGKVLAETNLKIIKNHDVDAIITGCATCATSLSHEYGLVLEESPLHATWEARKESVQDFSTFLCKLGYSTEFKPINRVVTYHDPCHLVRGMKVFKEPRELIKAIPGITFKEMKDADRCCGCAGMFSVNHYELSREINNDKIKAIMNTGADLTVTGCSACRMQIIDGLTQHNASVQVLHTAELLAMAYGANPT